MSVVILKWNPAISSFGSAAFVHHLYEARVLREPWMNWSVRDAKKIHKGDVLYWLKVGMGPCGIVGTGRATGEPYLAGNWNRGEKRRKVYYVDFRTTVGIDPATLPILGADALEAAVPGFDWRAGHSGVVLDAADGRKVERLWKSFLREHADVFETFGRSPNSGECHFYSWRKLKPAKG